MTILEFELIYKKYYPQAIYYCSRFNLPHEEIEDIVMNVFLIILCDLEKHKVPGMASFIVTSAKNKCVDMIRHKKIKNIHQRTLIEGIVDEIPTIETRDRRTRVLSIIDRLPTQQQRVIRLYLRGQSRDEMSKHLNIKPNTIRNHLQSGINNIRVRLAKEIIKK